MHLSMVSEWSPVGSNVACSAENQIRQHSLLRRHHSLTTPQLIRATAGVSTEMKREPITFTFKTLKMTNRYKRLFSLLIISQP